MFGKFRSDFRAARSRSDQDELVAFLHIPKTAGLTLTAILDRKYGPQEVHEVMMRGMSLRVPKPLLIAKPLLSFSKVRRLKSAVKRDPGLRLIRGHFDMSLARLLPANTRFFTLLRDPVERAISHYYHYRRQTADPVYPLAQRSTLEEWVSGCGLVEMDNGQTRRLAGALNLPYGRVTSRLLERAKANLAEKFAVVGLTERFEESLILLHRAFDLPLYRYQAVNVGNDRPRQGAVSTRALEVTRECNRFDLELYRFGSLLFEAALAKIDVEAELKRLRAAPELAAPAV